MSAYLRTVQQLSIGLLSFLILTLFALTPFKAEAAVSVLVNGGSGSNAERQIVTLNNQIRGYLQMLVAKEYNLDPTASAAAMRAAVAHYNEVRQYIASGDAGNPFFVDNLELYKAGIHSTTTNNTINELKNSKMCDFVKDDIIAELKKQYILQKAATVAEKNTCAFENTIAAEQFINQGKLDMGSLWNIINDPENTVPYSIQEKAKRLVAAQAEEAVTNAMEMLVDGVKPQYAAGQSVMVCTQKELPGGVRGTASGQVCRVASPAAAIRDMISGNQRVADIIRTSADERGEDATTAFINQAVQQTIVTGYTGTAYNPTRSSTIPAPTNPGGGPGTPGNELGDPFPDIPNDYRSTTTKAFLAVVAQNLNRASTTNPVAPALTRTLTKLQYQIEIVKLVDETEKAHQDAIVKYQPYNCYNLTFPNNFGNERTLTLTEAPQTILAIKQLYLALSMYEDAVKTNSSTAQAITLYQQIISTNFSIPNEIDLSDVTTKFNEFKNLQVGSFNTQFAQRVQACELIINPPEPDTNTDNGG